MEVQARTHTPPTPDPLSMNPSPGEMQDGDPDSDRPFPKRGERELHHVDHDRGQSLIKEPRLEKLSDSDDIEHFLITFERIAAACCWPKADWAFRLIPLKTMGQACI